MNSSTFAGNVRRILDERGLKHKAFAEKLGYSDKQFSAMLNHRRTVRDVDVVAIANALEVTPNELFGY